MIKIIGSHSKTAITTKIDIIERNYYKKLLFCKFFVVKIKVKYCKKLIGITELNRHFE